MLKVSDAAKPKTGEAAHYSGHSRERTGVSATGVSPVQGTFADVAMDIELRLLIDELDDIGSQLSRFPTGLLLGRYRELVGLLLDKARDNVRVRRDFKWRRTERSMFVVIERVEDALSELDDALIREGDRTRMLSLMEEIKGCLISLLF